MKPDYEKALEFEKYFSSEENCVAALKELRWPNGFVCPNCRHDVGYELSRGDLTQCAVCRRQTSVTAGTILEKTHMPLTIWFRMMYEVAQDKGGASSSKLAKRFGIPQKTAWHMLLKIRTAMGSRNKSIQLGGDIELDEAFFRKGGVQVPTRARHRNTSAGHGRHRRRTRWRCRNSSDR